MRDNPVDMIRRGIGYGWKNSLIVDVVKRKFGVNVSSQCIRHFRTGKPCPGPCRERCWIDE